MSCCHILTSCVAFCFETSMSTDWPIAYKTVMLFSICFEHRYTALCFIMCCHFVKCYAMLQDYACSISLDVCVVLKDMFFLLQYCKSVYFGVVKLDK